MKKVIDCFFNHNVLALEVDSFLINLCLLHVDEVLKRNCVSLIVRELYQHFLRDRFDILLDSRLNEVVAVEDEF